MEVSGVCLGGLGFKALSHTVYEYPVCGGRGGGAGGGIISQATITTTWVHHKAFSCRAGPLSVWLMGACWEVECCW